MATVSIVYNSSYKDKEKRSPVIFVIRHKSRHTHINSGIKVHKNHWDEKKMLKKGANGVIDHNAKNAELLRKKTHIQDFLTELTNKNEIEVLTATQIKERYLNKQVKEKYNFNTYFEYVISIKSESTATIYRRTLQLIEKFHSTPLSFSDINPKFLRELEHFYNQSTNGFAIHLRNIRHVFNMAIDDEVIDLGLYPFRRLKIKKEETEKRNLNIEDLRRLKSVPLSGVPGLARDLFMLQFYLVGISLKDIAYLKKTDVTDGYLIYTRFKTKKKYYLQLEPEALQIVKKLRGGIYLINLADRYENYDSIKKEINKKLKVAGKKAGIKSPITTYWSRHTWATLAHNLNIPEETIALALGHSSAHKTTNIYIERNIDKISEANKKIIHWLNMGPHQKLN
ncbi:site-specific integrase [Draconibacterium sp. IB214405]|uniref:tyrosine-type recombinase/integrase n=1 Tax=Draconibacterium sp. IB214405 TaxID=3097352 RepID=UPI002A0E1604|nr:site-specific integrase [Draconibacterium sp. IB214405]MDX8341139.1 site-specific integrase [Draconibacterium sp. IB214405]